MSHKCTLRLNTHCSRLTDFVLFNQYPLNTVHHQNARFEIDSDYGEMEEIATPSSRREMSLCKLCKHNVHRTHSETERERRRTEAESPCTHGMGDRRY